MTTWVLLIALYTIDGEPVESRLLFPNQSDCSDAISSMQQILSRSYDDVAVLCQRTNILSSTVRPVARPES